MIPFTVTFFSKQADCGHKLVPLAACYAFGIIGFFVLIGVLVAGVFGSSVSIFAGHWLTNLIIGAVFVVFALSLLGAFILQLPGGLELSLVVPQRLLWRPVDGCDVRHHCVYLYGTVCWLGLKEAVTGSGTWLRAIAGMAIYASAIAIPFFILAVSPRAY